MKKTGFSIFLILLFIFTVYLPNTFAQEFSLPEGAKARLGKGYRTGNSIFSKDGTRFAVASSIGLWIYDVHTGEEVALLPGHPSNFAVIASSPDGSILASANENTMSLWNAHTGRKIVTLTEHSEDITTLAFSPDGKVLASASEDDTVRLWDATTGKLLFLPLSGHAGDTIAIVFSPDSKMLASGSADNSIRLWSATTGQHLATLEEQIVWGTITHEGHTGDVTALAFSPGGTTLASGGTDNKIRLWDIGTKKHLTVLTGHTEKITALTFSKDGSILVSGSTENTIRLWNPAHEKHLDTLEGHESDVITLAFSMDGSTLASGDASNNVRLWDGNTGQHLDTLSLGNKMYGNPIRAVTFSPDGLTLVSGEGNSSTIASRCHLESQITSKYGLTRLWNTLIGEQRILSKDDIFVSCVAFSPDEETLVSGGTDLDLNVSIGHWHDLWSWCRVHGHLESARHPVQLWSTEASELLFNLEGHSNNVSSIAFAPDGKILASGSWDNTIRLWNPTTGQHLTTFYGHSDNVNTVAFSPNGGMLASGSDDDTIRLWNPAGEVHTLLAGHSDNVTSVAFSPDGQMLVSGSADGTIRVWNPITGEHIAILEGHTSGVSSVAFSVDGGTLASGSWDDTVRLWNATTGELLVTLSGHQSDVNAVVFSPDGTTLASGSSDGTTLLWEIEPAVSQDPLDVNGDGVVNLLDLTVVASNFGQIGENVADVNGDGVVNVTDIVLVAGAMGAAPAAPSISPQILETLTIAEIQRWLIDAKQLKLTYTARQRGIIVLEQLLEVLMRAEIIPTETALLPNYPNPFNPETWIPYQLAESADVTISIYSAEGKLVQTLTLGYQPIGIYASRSRAAYWDGRNTIGEPVASGIYFYTFTAGKFSSTRKMLIRK